MWRGYAVQAVTCSELARSEGPTPASAPGPDGTSGAPAAAASCCRITLSKLQLMFPHGDHTLRMWVGWEKVIAAAESRVKQPPAAMRAPAARQPAGCQSACQCYRHGRQRQQWHPASAWHPPAVLPQAAAAASTAAAGRPAAPPLPAGHQAQGLHSNPLRL